MTVISTGQHCFHSIGKYEMVVTLISEFLSVSCSLLCLFAVRLIRLEDILLVINRLCIT